MGLLLKSKRVTAALSVLGFAALMACSQNTGGKSEAGSTADSASCAKPSSRNPNGESELSTLMRKMQDNSLELRALVEKAELPKNLPKEFAAIYTAKPTDADTKHESFNRFAANYLSNLEAVYESDQSNFKRNYNQLVNACESCHMEHCPGPLKAIAKLKL